MKKILHTVFSGNYLIGLSGLSISYFLAGLIGLEMQSAQTGITPFWPASGIMFAAFVLYGIKLWPAVYISMIALALIVGYPVWFALLSATGSILEIAVPLYFARKKGFTDTLGSIRQLYIFILISWTGPIISASMGMLGLLIMDTELTIPTINIFLIWWLGNSFGILLVGSSLILLYPCIKKNYCLVLRNAIVLGVTLCAAVISISAFHNIGDLNSTLLLNLMIPLVVLSSIFIGFAGTLIPVSIACFTMIILSPGFPEDATSQYPLGILYLDILELWIITLTGLLVSTAHQESLRHMKNDWILSHDGLTQLKNRRYFDHKLHDICSGLRHSDNRFSLLFLDLNKFKQVNDSAGHLAGDACLAHVARLLQQSTRTTDTVARWGGDEFMILLPDCNTETARAIASKINQQLEDNPFSFNQQQYELSFSIGISSSRIDDTPALIIDRADKSCYREKLLDQEGEKIAL
ncbi:MAG: diguanylate cyclase [Gammaproteobacteria bacterium]|nr:diguanylate cyclase [Gammaproteobacteria bacterium]MBL7000105.1 diguanylate cyclase [Gammaproteobacteria bacterium]